MTFNALGVNNLLYKTEEIADKDNNVVSYPSSLSLSSNSTEIKTSNIASGELIGDIVISGGFIRSANYKQNTSGWTINVDGTVEFETGYFRGDISGATGEVTTSIFIGSGNTVFKADGSNGMYLGNASFSSAPFRVSLGGVVTATSGTVGGFTLSSAALYAGTTTTRIQLDTTSGIHLGATAFADALFSVSLAGSLKAVSGTIANWTLSTTAISTGAYDTLDKMYFGSSGLSLSNAFKVTSAGVLTVSSATVTTLTTGSIIGGSAVGSNITYKSTTGVGTAAGVAHQWTGGTDGGTVIATMLNNGSMGIGTASPTAVLHLKAGTATASTAPLKFTSGTLNTTAEAGAIEYLTDNLHFTIATGTARKGIVLDDGTRLTSGKIPVATTNGRLIDLTPQAAEADLKTDYTAGDLDTEAEIITAINATNTKINAIIAKLEALGLLSN